MELSGQVTNLELSKKLKELRVKQDSIFFHAVGGVVSRIETLPILDSNYPAFIASELFDLLPQYINTKKDEPFNNFIFNMRINNIFNDENKLCRVYSINYHCDTMHFDKASPFFALNLLKHNIYDENCANALAKTLIYLIESGYYEPKRSI